MSAARRPVSDAGGRGFESHHGDQCYLQEDEVVLRSYRGGDMGQEITTGYNSIRRTTFYACYNRVAKYLH